MKACIFTYIRAFNDDDAGNDDNDDDADVGNEGVDDDDDNSGVEVVMGMIVSGAPPTILRSTTTTVTVHCACPPCAQNDKINVLHEPYFGTHILGNHLPFQTSEIPKKNTKPLISIRGLAFDKLLQSSEK